MGSVETGDGRSGMNLSQSRYVVVDVLTAQVTAQVIQIDLTRLTDGSASFVVALIRSTQTF